MEKAVLQRFVANWEWKVSQQTQLMEMMWHSGMLLMQERVETQKSTDWKKKKWGEDGGVFDKKIKK